MDKFVMLYHHYCPVVEKNIVIERTIFDDDTQQNVCLNSHQCECGLGCQNKLLDLEIKISASKI